MPDKTQDPIQEAPDAFVDIARAVNDLARKVKPMKGGRGVSVKVGDDYVLISLSGSLPPTGYGPEQFTICEDGAPATRNFITDNPDPIA